MRKITLSILLSSILMFFTLTVSAQEIVVLKYTSTQIEKLFLEQNLGLIAEKMNISLAEAEIAQVKLWDNPELSIGPANMWSTRKQKEELGAKGFPKNTQFSIELSQLIQTANKRNKLVDTKKVSKEIAIQNFEGILIGLKTELRKLIYETEYLQSYQKALSIQQKSLEELIFSYQKQVAQGNIAKSELLRLQSSLFELESEINEIQTDLNEQQKSLKSLLNISPFCIIEIVKTNIRNINPDDISLASILEKANELHPDIKRGQLQTLFHQKSLVYEKSQRIPDITVSVAYDRSGGVWKDFVGFGVSFDLPFFNRNQGNIKAEKINIEQSKLLNLQQQNIVQQEIAKTFSNYSQAYKFYKTIATNELLTDMDEIPHIYAKNLLNKNIGMLEYLDLIETYKNNKKIILTSYKNLNVLFEELQYAVGSEIK